MDKKFSIIIPVHNQFELLDQCIQSIKKNTAQDYELILSDSNSDRKLREYYTMLDPDIKVIKVIEDDTKPGFSRAINNGMKAARDSDFYIWLNSDTIVTKNWLNSIEDQDLCGPISSQATYQTMLMIDKKNIPDVEQFLSDVKISNLKTDFLNGFCYIINKRVFQSVGFLDEKHFPHYASEDDYSLRAKLKGFQAEILSNCFVYHEGNQSYKSGIADERRKNDKVFLSRYPKAWFDNLIMLHTVRTRNLRQQLVERFIEYYAEEESS